MRLARATNRDIIVRIARSVRLARLLDTDIADAVWARLPYYGTAQHTGDGRLCIPIDLTIDPGGPGQPRATADSPAASITGSELVYCPDTRSIVFSHQGVPAAGTTQPAANLLPWARLLSPYPPYLLAALPHGARAMLLHGDS